jgi:hypothetical protein
MVDSQLGKGYERHESAKFSSVTGIKIHPRYPQQEEMTRKKRKAVFETSG